MRNRHYTFLNGFIKKATFMAILLFASTHLQGQSLFETAQEMDLLYRQIKTGDGEAKEKFIKELLSLYRFDEDLTVGRLLKDFSENKFMSKEVAAVLSTDTSLVNNIIEQTKSTFFLSGSTGRDMPFEAAGAPAVAAISPIVLQQGGSSGSAASAIIDGTSKWVAERMREELSIAFFDRFEYWVEGKNIHLLFPNTFASLNSSISTDW